MMSFCPSLLLLSLVAEPDAYHILFQVQLLGDGRNLLSTRPWLQSKVGFQRALLGRSYARSLPLLLHVGQNSVRVGHEAVDLDTGQFQFGRIFGLFKPGVQDGLEGDHVVVGEG